MRRLLLRVAEFDLTVGDPARAADFFVDGDRGVVVRDPDGHHVRILAREGSI